MAGWDSPRLRFIPAQRVAVDSFIQLDTKKPACHNPGPEPSLVQTPLTGVYTLGEFDFPQ